MIDRASLKKAFTEAPERWFSVDDLSQILGFTGKPSEIESELNNLYDTLPGPLGFESISPGTVNVVVMRPDADGNRWRYAPGMDGEAWASVVHAYLSAALSASGGAVTEHMDRAAAALAAMRTKLLEG